MSVSAENYLIRLKPSTFLIKASYAEVIIQISALHKFLLARSVTGGVTDMTFGKAALGRLKALSAQGSAALAWCSLLDTR